MSIAQSYIMRLRRKRHQVRAFRKHFSLRQVVNRTGRIRGGDILLFSTMRDEAVRLPYFLRYYRDLGVSHFLIVDNDSSDGGRELMSDNHLGRCRQPPWPVGLNGGRACPSGGQPHRPD